MHDDAHVPTSADFAMAAIRSCSDVWLALTQQDVGVQAALVRLVDDDGAVAAQQEVLLDLAHQDAVRHELHRRRVADPPVIPHLRSADAEYERAEQARGGFKVYWIGFRRMSLRCSSGRVGQHCGQGDCLWGLETGFL